MGKRIGLVLALLALLAAACGGEEEKAGPSTYSVGVDAKDPDLNTNFFAFFPDELQAHPGDMVEFKVDFTGDPHTVTLGTLVGEGLAAVEKLGPNPKGSAVNALPEMQKLPNILPAGPGDANQSAAQLCFLDTVAPPAKDACTQRTQPEFTGKQSFYNSGWLPEDAVFRVKLAEDIQPGSYQFLCLVHRQHMTGTLNVAGSSAKIPTPAQATQRGKAELDKRRQVLKTAVDAVQATPEKAFAGVGRAADRNSNAALFLPKEISIPVGGTVTWTIFGPHTIGFNAPEEAKTLLSKAPDGSVHLNPQAVAPTGSKGFPPPPEEPKTVTIDDGAWDGKAFHSTGLIRGFPPATFVYKLAFTQAGTYKFACSVHTDMEGTVKVG